MSSKKILIAYFSRIGEEYGVGNIIQGNTQLVAGIITQKVSGDTFIIQPLKKYPDNYEECKRIAIHEKVIKERPKIIGEVKNFQMYEIIFLGYPIWYNDAPMAIYTFLESYDFGGKKIILFCTHGGSGFASTDKNISLSCPNSKVIKGFAVLGTTAQGDREQTKFVVDSNLKRLGNI